MKKITLLLAAFAVTTLMTAQDVLTHSTDNTFLVGGSVACASDPDGTAGTGDEGNSDNIYYRAYTPTDFGYAAGFEVQGANFYLTFNDVGATSPTVEIIVSAYTSDATFPAGNLTAIATQVVEVTLADDQQLLNVVFDTAVTVPATTEVIIAVEVAAAPLSPDNYDVRIGQNDLGENDPSYLSSVGCGLLDPGTFAAIGFPDNSLILDLVGGDAVLGVNDTLLAEVSVYPNPTSDVLNVKVPATVEVTNAVLYDVLGKNTGVELVNGSMNTVNLARGVYILSINTTAGSLTEKVVKN